STMNTSLTARPLSGPSRAATVTSAPASPVTSNTLANRFPAKMVSRQPRSSFGAGGALPGADRFCLKRVDAALRVRIAQRRNHPGVPAQRWIDDDIVMTHFAQFRRVGGPVALHAAR